MKPQKGYYSVIQYCPELSKFEVANIGVLLFCPESGFLKAHTSKNNERIRKFFGSKGQDWKRINVLKKSLQDRLQKEQRTIRDLDDLKQFITSRANVIQITPPLPMKVFDPEKDLLELYGRLVGEKTKKKERTALKKLVGRKFIEAGLENKIVSDIKVEVPVLGKEIEIPFGFQNGRFNLINPVRFGASKPQQSFQTACKYAVEGRSLFEHPDPKRGQLQLIVFGEFRPKDNESRTLVRRVLDEHDVKLFSAEELPKLIAEIKQTGKEVR
ncbi:MAG: hypothetical protein Tsb009_27040 [Planctomycetaceae bacterium]